MPSTATVDLPAPEQLRAAALTLDSARAAEGRAMLRGHLSAITDRARATWTADPSAAAQDLIAADALLMQTEDGEGHEQLLAEGARRIRHRCTVQASLLDLQRARAAFLRGAYERCLAIVVPLARRWDNHAGTSEHQDLFAWPPDPGLLWARAVAVRTAAERYIGEGAQAAHRCETLVQAGRRSPTVATLAAFHRGTALACIGRLDEADSLLREALSLSLRSGLFRLRALAFCNLSIVASRRGETSLALGWAIESRRRLTACGDWIMVGKLFAREAEYLAAVNDTRTARARAERAYRLGVRCGDFETQTNVVLQASATDIEAEGLRSARAEALRSDARALGLNLLVHRLAEVDMDPNLPHVALNGTTVTVVADGRPTTIELGARPVLLRVMHVLAEARRQGRSGVSADGLLLSAWPDERPERSSGLNRVYAAIRLLRKLGLADAIQRSASGYRLAWPVRFG